MGFHVRLAEQDAEFVRRLSEKPDHAFPRGYAGYLLFLVGGAHRDALEWLKTNIINLDSATGHVVAFAVFARKVPLHLQTGGDGGSSRVVGECSVAELSIIDRICKHGKFGWVRDGDLIEASTYAVDQAARDLDVVDQLPCVVVIDAVPRDKLVFFPLDEDARADLVPSIRSAVARIQRAEQYDDYLRKLKFLADADVTAARIECDLANVERELRNCPDDGVLPKKVDLCMSAIEGDLRMGITRRFLQHLNTLKDIGLSAGQALPAELCVRISQLRATELNLSKYRKQEWPLGPRQEENLADVFRRHVKRLLPGYELPSPRIAPEDVDKALRQIRDAHDADIAMATFAIKGENGLIQQAIAALREKRTQLQYVHAERLFQLTALQQRCADVERDCRSIASLSFSKYLSEEAQSRRLRSFFVQIKAAVKRWLKLATEKVTDPDRLLKD